ncbi:MAG: sigma-70 family RNA polymerase sigma factor [Myxococcales bacterium]|nr:sigma-70 family RNA polymerase sigma factor [Myxococcales bacterium]
MSTASWCGILLQTAQSTAPMREPASELVIRAQRGDRDALGALLRAHGPMVLRLTHHLLGEVEGRDAAQQVFERIVRAIDSFDPSRASFRTWAMTIARNTCRDRFRRRKLERAAFSAEGEQEIGAARARRGDPERGLLRQVDAARLERALGGLPEGMREAIVLFHVGGMAYEEIARTLEIPIGTVMTWLYRGRRRLRVALEEGS